MKLRSEREQDHFNRLAEEYESLFCLNKPAALRKVKRLCEEYSHWLNQAPDGKILEIGAGTGFYTRHLCPLIPKLKYFASDISSEMLTIAENSFEAQKFDITFALIDCTQTDLDDDSIAAITGHAILHHVPLEETIRESSRILKSKGRLAFYEPNILNPYVFLIKKIPFLRPTR